jgi:ubiquinol-cytochrome c reductase subunit 8
LVYGISPNRQNPFAGAAHDAVFNTWRRFYSQVFYWAPAAVAGYYIMNWAIERYVVPPWTNGGLQCLLTWDDSNHYLNSKQGRLEFGADAEEA